MSNSYEKLDAAIREMYPEEENYSIVCGSSGAYAVVKGKFLLGLHRGRIQEYTKGDNYIVEPRNNSYQRHRGAAGTYIGCKNNRGNILAMLRCLGKTFMVESCHLVPFEGDITEAHKNSITTLKKFHVLVDGKCVCECETTGETDRKVGLEEFFELPCGKQCVNCRKILKKDMDDS